MTQKLTLSTLLLWLSYQLVAQNPSLYGTMITPLELKENLNILASDLMEGRETGKRGQKMAAAFISSNFEELGLQGPVEKTFYQTFELYTKASGENYVKIGGNRYQNFQDVVYYGTADSDGETLLPLVFAGKGRAEDLDQLDITGKGIAISLEQQDDFRKPAEDALARGAKMVFIILKSPEEFKTLSNQFKNYLNTEPLLLKKPEANSAGPGIFFLSPAVAEKALNQTLDKLLKTTSEDPRKKPLKKLKPGSIVYKTSLNIKTVKTENVLGYLEGTDKKDELLVITAHYDHIGKRKNGTGDLINNGADDDGSGTVTVLQLAKVFMQAKKDGHGPRRSILFMTVTGEEKGLLGSEYYTQHPVFPLANTVVNLNIDMIGRRDFNHKESPPYVYVIGSDKLSTELHTINEVTNKTYTNLLFDYTYNDEKHPDRLYYRSDHWNFAKNNIPIIFYFDGIHEDYHRTTDEVDKIEFDLLAKRAQQIFYTAWEIANREQRIAVDKK